MSCDDTSSSLPSSAVSFSFFKLCLKGVEEAEVTLLVAAAEVLHGLSFFMEERHGLSVACSTGWIVWMCVSCQFRYFRYSYQVPGEWQEGGGGASSCGGGGRRD